MRRDFRRADAREERALRRNLDFIKSIGDYVDEYLADKKIHILTDSQHLELIINKNNLLHLLGIQYVTGNHRFWEDLQADILQAHDLRIQTFTLEKLRAMHAFPSLFKGEAMLTDNFVLRHIVVNKALHTRKLVLAIGLDKDAKFGFYFPRTAISLKRYTLDMEKGERVREVYTVDRKTGKIIYLQKN